MNPQDAARAVEIVRKIKEMALNAGKEVATQAMEFGAGAITDEQRQEFRKLPIRQQLGQSVLGSMAGITPLTFGATPKFGFNPKGAAIGYGIGAGSEALAQDKPTLKSTLLSPNALLGGAIGGVVAPEIPKVDLKNRKGSADLNYEFGSKKNIVNSVKAVEKVKPPVEGGVKEGGELITLHNLSESGIQKADRMGGIPAPSLSITKKDIPFEGYGDVSLVGGKNFAEGDVYTSDVYTRRVPKQRYKLNEVEKYKALEDIKPYLEKTGDYQYGRLHSALSEDTASPKELLYQGNESNAVKAMYLKEVKGIDIGENLKPKNIRKDLANAQLGLDKRSLAESDIVKDLITSGKYKKLQAVEWEDKVNNPQKYNEAVNISKNIIDDVYNSVLKRTGDKTLAGYQRDFANKAFFAEDGTFLTPSYYNFVSKLKDYASKGLKEVDTIKVSEIIDKNFQKIDKKDFNKWLTDRFGSVYGRSYFLDNAGRSKNYSMENILDYMTGRVRGQENFFYGAGSVKSKISKKLYGVEEVRANKDLIQPESVTKKIHEDFQNELGDLIEEIKGQSEWRTSDSFGIYDQIGKDIASVGQNISESKVFSALRRAGVEEPSSELISKTKDFLTRLKKGPVNYFEAKPQRAVQLNEFNGALVPKGTDTKTLDILKNKGLKVVEYDPKIENNRADMIKKHFGNVLFTSLAALGLGSNILGIKKESSSEQPTGQTPPGWVLQSISDINKNKLTSN